MFIYQTLLANMLSRLFAQHFQISSLIVSVSAEDHVLPLCPVKGKRKRGQVSKIKQDYFKNATTFMHSASLFVLVNVPLPSGAYICPHGPVQQEKQSCFHHSWMIVFNCTVSSRGENWFFFLPEPPPALNPPLCHEKRKCLFTQKPTGLPACHPNGNGQGWGRSIAICTHSWSNNIQ